MMRTHRSRLLALLVGTCLALVAGTAFSQANEYDAAGRLTKVTYDDGSGIAYTYDAAGNITQVQRVGPGGPTPDAGMGPSADAGAGPGGEGPGAEADGCGCATLGKRPESDASATLLIFLVCVVVTRRRPLEQRSRRSGGPPHP